MRGRLLKVAPEICRHATLTELRACKAVASELALQSKRLTSQPGKQVYEDVTDLGDLDDADLRTIAEASGPEEVSPEAKQKTQCTAREED